MRWRIVLGLLVILSAAIYFNNASWLAPAQTGKPVLLAHSGVHQTFRRTDLTAESCTATKIYPPTHNFGKTFPLRGKGVGAMPTLNEVLAEFPGKGFLIHIKSRDKTEGEKLAALLARLAPEERASLAIYGDTAPVEEVKRQLPDLYIGASGVLKNCLLGYIAIGWSGYVPTACRERVMLVPVNVAPWLWGWPNRFMARIKSAQTVVFILGDHDGSFSTGIDTAEDLSRLPKPFSGGIWTNKIEVLGPLMR
jgi:glycerophosphoryl diester phosphodiesterase